MLRIESRENCVQEHLDCIVAIHLVWIASIVVQPLKVRRDSMCFDSKHRIADTTLARVVAEKGQEHSQPRQALRHQRTSNVPGCGTRTRGKRGRKPDYWHVDERSLGAGRCGLRSSMNGVAGGGLEGASMFGSLICVCAVAGTWTSQFRRGARR